MKQDCVKRKDENYFGKLQIFEKKKEKKLQESEREKAIKREREREYFQAYKKIKEKKLVLVREEEGQVGCLSVLKQGA